ncbi:MAG TPA: PilZ domain-containing protein [Candidatus Acidoferrales bacterium]|nr:PilZ domain-containing protein [Candidatus Acidoferrales bacterium]
MPTQTYRYEKRIATVVPVYLSRLGPEAPVETGFTENVSRHGARVLTRGEWRPGDSVVISSRRGNLQSQARVIYCQHLAGTATVIGLQLSSPHGDWLSNL